MKKIKAFVKSHRLSEVTLALRKVGGMPGMSVTEVKGFGSNNKVRSTRRVSQLDYPKCSIINAPDRTILELSNRLWSTF